MRFLLATILTALLGFIAGMFLPWWSIAIVSFLVALLIKQSPGRSFLAGFLALFILWGWLAAWFVKKNVIILSKKLSQFFFIGRIVACTHPCQRGSGSFGCRFRGYERCFSLSERKRAIKCYRQKFRVRVVVITPDYITSQFLNPINQSIWH